MFFKVHGCAATKDWKHKKKEFAELRCLLVLCAVVYACTCTHPVFTNTDFTRN